MEKKRVSVKYILFYSDTEGKWVGLCKTPAGRFSWRVTGKDKKGVYTKLVDRYEQYEETF
jgi:hypothetical protein